MFSDDEDARLAFHKLPTDLQVDIESFEEILAGHNLVLELVGIHKEHRPGRQDRLEIVIRITD